MPRRDDDRYDDDDYEDDGYDDDDTPRGRRRGRRRADPTGGLIPLTNPPALIGYYCAVFGLIPCLGLPLSVAAVVLGFVGRSKHVRDPRVGGVAHAWVALILGGIELLVYILITLGMGIAGALA